MNNNPRGNNDNNWENQNYGSSQSNLDNTNNLLDNTFKDDYQYMQDVANSYGGHVGNKYADIIQKVNSA